MAKSATGRFIVKGFSYAPKTHGEDQGKVTLLFSWKDDDLRAQLSELAGRDCEVVMTEHESQPDLDGIDDDEEYDDPRQTNFDSEIDSAFAEPDLGSA